MHKFHNDMLTSLYIHFSKQSGDKSVNYVRQDIKQINIIIYISSVKLCMGNSKISDNTWPEIGDMR